MFSKNEIVEILKDDTKNQWVFDLADKIRKENVGDDVHLRGLIEFSNICKCSCKYCGIRSFNKNISRYRMYESEIIDLAQKAVEFGYKTVVLQSGEDSYFDVGKMCKIIENIKDKGVALTLSIGERSFDDYKAFKESGADRYLLRIETTDENLYKKMHPNMSFQNRLRCLRDLKELGYEVGTGCLVGLPEQSLESLADDILFFKEIDADMIGVGPFIAHPQTPLKNEKSGDFYLALKVMALTRIMLPDINIPATTAMETLNPDGRKLALNSGANVIMPNVTDINYSSKYEIYPNKANLQNVKELIKSINRNVASDFGFRNKEMK